MNTRHLRISIASVCLLVIAVCVMSALVHLATAT